MQKAAIGFGSAKRTGEDTEAINRMFSPEFRNRLDAVIPFGSLPTPVIHQVVQKFVMQLETQLAERGVTFDLSKDAIAWLADKGYDEHMGARPRARVIQEHIKKELANEVLFGKLKKGGTVKVTVETKEDGKTGLKLDAIPDEVPVKPAKKPADRKTTKPKSSAKSRAKPSRDGDAPGTPPADEPVAPEGGSTQAAVSEREPKTARKSGGTVPKVPRRK
jgi:ATP-dependent Clp protease ATP-binding subunit ClpA